MFSIQSRFFEATRPCSSDDFWQVVRSESVKATIHECRQLLDAGDKKGYSAKKQSLPGFIFMSEIMPNTSPDKQGRPRPEARWRVQEAARLNGLVMCDYDTKENPTLTDPWGYWRQFIDQHLWLLDEAAEGPTVMLAHVTPGRGLRLVVTADKQTGNLFDNAVRMANIIGLKSDDSCKDASRTSFVPMEEDILYINDKIFEYDDEAYEKAYGSLYRAGGSKKADGRGKKEDGRGKMDDGRCKMADGRCKMADGRGKMADGRGKKEDGRGKMDDGRCKMDDGSGPVKCQNYHGVDMQRIADAWILEYPKIETRHGKMLEAAADLRYLVESPEELVAALMTLDCVRQINEERGMKEIEDAADGAWTGPRYKRIPQRVQKVLIRAGVDDTQDAPTGKGKVEDEERVRQMSALRVFAHRIKPLLAAPYDTVCEGVEDENLLSHIFAAGTMFCTLMTRCTYTHYDGKEHRMNPQALIIAPPASGKSGIDTLNKQVMAALRASDQISRDALKEYKRKRKERATSSKEQKQAALVEPQGMIRVLLSNTSNNQFYKRLMNAREEVGQELMWLHVYMFDSELASANKANGGADWIGKRDMELKAFENEDAGSDYANDDSVNDFVPVHWNMVTTGTAIALAKKFTLANINDGLATRVAIAPMDPLRYKMVARGSQHRNLEREARLKQWGFWFDRQQGHLELDRLVDHAYELCEQSAAEAEELKDDVLDTLRRRAVFYAEWFTVPRIVARLRREDGTTAPLDELTVTDDDLQWATVMYEAVLYWQDYFFGQMLQESWENGKRCFQPRQRTSRNAQLYAQLPQEFTTKEAANLLGTNENAVNAQLSRWVKSGYVERKGQGKYKKLIAQIV